MREDETAEGRRLDAVTTLKAISMSGCNVGDGKGGSDQSEMVTYFQAKFSFINIVYKGKLPP